MKVNRVIGWVVAESKQEAIEALEKMLETANEIDEGVDSVNMHFVKEGSIGEEA